MIFQTLSLFLYGLRATYAKHDVFKFIELEIHLLNFVNENGRKSIFPKHKCQHGRLHLIAPSCQYRVHNEHSAPCCTTYLYMLVSSIRSWIIWHVFIVRIPVSLPSHHIFSAQNRKVLFFLRGIPPVFITNYLGHWYFSCCHNSWLFIVINAIKSLKSAKRQLNLLFIRYCN